MKRQLTAFIIAVILLTSAFPMSAYAFDRPEHDAYLESVLFGDPEYKDSQPEKIKEKVQMLEYASFLSIDQYRGEGKKDLYFLKTQKVRNLPKLEEFDLTGIFYGNHRNYTHRGWDYVYPIPKGEKHDKANWPVRKDLLCSTVNKVFDFGIGNELFGNICNQCNSFSALVYYTHILGDHLERKSYKADDLTIPLARGHASESNPDVFWEIKKHCEILFESQKDSATYYSFMQELEVLSNKARRLAGTGSGINESNFPQYKQYTEDLMETLISYIPLMLENEEFFKKEFYTNEISGRKAS